jgi:3-isopropylmalate/(R)-2-methylmalate dehydratase small subunit
MQPFRTHKGKFAPHDRANIDTDQIIPKQFLKRIERTGFGEFLFYDWRRSNNGSQDPSFSLNQERYKGASVLVTGKNFGCGSSREHAPWALTAWGIRAVVSSSFADIFRGNALKNGLLPVAVPPEELLRLREIIEAEPDDELIVDLEASELRLPDGSAIDFDVDPFARSMLLAGTDELGYLLSLEPAIAAYEATHPALISTRQT